MVPSSPVDPLDFDDLHRSSVPGKAWNGMPEETVIGHIHLHVSELEKTEEFYVKGLGFDVVNRYGKQALFLSTGKYHHHIGVNTWNGVGAQNPSENSVGLEFYTLILPDEEARKGTITNLQKIGVEVVEEDRKIIVSDPSGNRIELAI